MKTFSSPPPTNSGMCDRWGGSGGWGMSGPWGGMSGGGVRGPIVHIISLLFECAL